MNLDLAILFSREAVGIFEQDPDAYARYAVVRRDVIQNIRRIITEESMLASFSSPQLDALAEQLKKTPEQSFNIVYFDMLENGAAWQHLILLRAIAGINPVPSEHQGMFYRQIGDWITWVEDRRYGTVKMEAGL